jgi:AcrR family transcriptional regulator
VVNTDLFYRIPVARPYRSARRTAQAAQTREAVLHAARRLFAERGWAATGVREVAAAAGVSVETVYGAVGAKAALLHAAYEGTVVGDDDPTPLAERPQFRAMGEGDTLAERAAAAAALITAIHQRSAALFTALREGSSSEGALAEILRTDERNRWIDDKRGMEMVYRAEVDDAAVDAFWAITSPEVYELLGRRGWDDRRYADHITRVILEGAPGQHASDQGEQPCRTTRTDPPTPP